VSLARTISSPGAHCRQKALAQIERMDEESKRTGDASKKPH
jgi:hypothetical protein